MKPMPEPDVAQPRTQWRPSAIEVIAMYPALFIGTLLVGAAMGAGTTRLLMAMADDEAPIRVRNGSLELVLEDTAQAWEPIGASAMWRIQDRQKPADMFEVTVHANQGATCSGTNPVTQPYVRLTYHAQTNDVINLDTPGHFTRVNPSNGVTLTSPSATPYVLKYDTTGYLAEIAAGPNAGQLTVICSFASGAQLDHIIIKTP